MKALTPNPDDWSKHISENNDASQRRWESALCLTIALLFIAMFIGNTIALPFHIKLFFLIGLTILLGVFLTIGKQFINKADNPQIELKKIISVSLLNYARTMAILILIIVKIRKIN